MNYQSSPVGATVTLYNGADTQIAQAITNADTGNYSFDAIPCDTGYKLVVSKPGYCSYTLTNITIDGIKQIQNIDISCLAGDVLLDQKVNGYDLNELLKVFNKK
ncbi:MAG: carboxypeptidase-like regulatory domain-containing protein, partial [Oscillospiraceae bacterium]